MTVVRRFGRRRWRCRWRRGRRRHRRPCESTVDFGRRAGDGVAADSRLPQPPDLVEALDQVRDAASSRRHRGSGALARQVASRGRAHPGSGQPPARAAPVQFVSGAGSPGRATAARRCCRNRPAPHRQPSRRPTITLFNPIGALTLETPPVAASLHWNCFRSLPEAQPLGERRRQARGVDRDRPPLRCRSRLRCRSPSTRRGRARSQAARGSPSRGCPTLPGFSSHSPSLSRAPLRRRASRRSADWPSGR